MIPVLYKFVFNTPLSQWALYLAALGVVAYAFFSGWRGAQGAFNPKTKEFAPASREQKLQRGAIYAAIGAGLALFGLHYALPAGVPLGAKGEGLPIHTYGVLLAAGFVCAVTLASKLAEKEWSGSGPTYEKSSSGAEIMTFEEGARKRDLMLDLAFYVLIAGILGSHVLFVMVNYKDYVDQPLNIFKPGGLVFYGGLIAAMGASYWFAKKNNMDFLRLADIGLPAVSLGQALGRLGCFSAGCCWGDVAHQGYHWGVHFPGSKVALNAFGQSSGTASLAYQSMASDGRWVLESTGQIFKEPVAGAVRISDWVAQHGTTLPVHPTQLYESIGQICLLMVMLVMRRYRRFHGQIFAFWLMGYAVLRSTVELFRGDLERGTLSGLLSALKITDNLPKEAWYNISTSQFISLCMFALGATVLVRRGRQVWNRGAVGPTSAAVSA